MIHTCAPHLSSPFVRPTLAVESTTDASPEQALRTLPELVAFNALHNANHIFCIQYYHNLDTTPLQVTYSALHEASLRCCAWLEKQQLARTPALIRPEIVDNAPIAILMSSDVSWFIAFLALLRLGIPVSASVVDDNQS